MINRRKDGSWEVDTRLDASLMGLWYFGMFEPDHPQIVSTMEAVKNRLWVRTEVGGMARYEDDYYHQVSDDLHNVPGNPWFVSTLWLAQWYIARAKNPAELKKALEIMQWVAERTLKSGVMAEQVHPYTHCATFREPAHLEPCGIRSDRAGVYPQTPAGDSAENLI
jgi:GH15 family glucan-1,4-alpha-glucosidase